MKILTYESGYVDLEAPIQMTEEQREKFIEFFKKTFPGNVETYEKKEKTKNLGERDVDQKKWTVDNLELLLSPSSNSDLAAKMDRTEMGVKMQRGHFVPGFLVWLKKKGYSLPANKKLIKEYMNEKEVEYENINR